MAWYDQNQNGTVERSFDRFADPSSRASASAGFMHLVYQHMAMGLGVTGAVAMYTAQNAPLDLMVRSHPYVLIFAQLGMVMGLTFLIKRLSAFAAGALFYAYSAMTGLLLSTIFHVYTHQSIALTFFVTAGTFGAISVYGYVTKRDLTGVGNFAIMGLFGLIIASIANMFLQSSAIQWITTYIGVIVFVALTAYDTQKLKVMGEEAEGSAERSKFGIIGALMLYLDFINLFLYLLRLFGDRRSND
jgi:FtsH-binding integral membrane protein